MPEKYHIDVKNVPPRHHPVGKYSTVEFWENCAGSCRLCVKKRCVYGIFKDNYLHMTTMDEPLYLYTCNSCFRCVQECTKGIFSRVINPEYRTLGDEYWTPDILHRTWYQAHTGSIPVSGAGYRGPFVGKGFDSMWTDMSEIVRPTRDGIHGREYINTCIELSRRPPRLRFNEDMSLAVEVGPIFEIPIPILFQQPSFGAPGRNTLVAMAAAASAIGTLMLVDATDLEADLDGYAANIMPRVTRANYADHSGFLKTCKMVEIGYEPGIAAEFEKLRRINPALFIAVGIPLNKDAAAIATQLADSGVDTLHYYADDNGRELDAENPRFLKEMIREVHLALVDISRRQELNLIFSGGIALAEHVNKAIICGADGVAIDNPLLIAMECRMCGRCKDGLSCTATLEEIDPAFGRDRIVNLMGAWRNQMLEMLGAMGLREARRLRGEVGRSMWFEDLEKENFGPLFGERKVPPVL
jgi:ferredoxin